MFSYLVAALPSWRQDEIPRITRKIWSTATASEALRESGSGGPHGGKRVVWSGARITLKLFRGFRGLWVVAGVGFWRGGLVTLAIALQCLCGNVTDL